MYLEGDITEVRPKADPAGRYAPRDYVRVHASAIQQYIGLEVDRDLVKVGESVRLLVVPGVSKSGKLYYSVRSKAAPAALYLDDSVAA